MSYQIEVTADALEDLRRLPSYVRPQAKHFIDTLADEPRPARTTELRGKPGVYRLWLAGRWRIVYEIDDAARVVLIRRVRPKAAIDYPSL